MAEPANQMTRRNALPADIAALQSQLETQFLTAKTLAQEVTALRAARPVLFQRPARPTLAMRLLMRALPGLRRRYHLKVLRVCGLFDAGWYLETYPDIGAAGLDPARHYLDTGAREGRDPGPHFDTAHYLAMYPDIAAGALNPLVHYVLSGWAEGRSIHPDMPHDDRIPPA